MYRLQSKQVSLPALLSIPTAPKTLNDYQDSGGLLVHFVMVAVALVVVEHVAIEIGKLAL